MDDQVRAELRQQAIAAIDAHAAEIVGVADQIHKRPETGFQERFASQLLADALSHHGSAVEYPVGGLDTALRATKRGQATGPTIAVLAEYDALPGIGHGCGHNLIAASGLAAAIGLGPVMDQLDGTFQVIGTPAEEGGGGKIALIDAGIFTENGPESPLGFSQGMNGPLALRATSCGGRLCCGHVAPCQPNRIWASHGKSPPWVKVRAYFGRGAIRLSRVA